MNVKETHLDQLFADAVALDDERDARGINQQSSGKEHMAAYDDRFDEAEAEVDRGEAWKVHEKGVLNPGMPNPLTILATGWSTIHTQYGEAELLNGTAKDGKRWSVLAGSTVLQKRLIEGLIEEWDAEANKFAVVETLGKVAPGEVVSIKFLGIKEGASFNYPNYSVVRKPASTNGADPQEGGRYSPEDMQGDEFPEGY